MKIISTWLLTILSILSASSQNMKFQEQNYVVEVNELKTSYLFINGIDNPTLDIGSKACIGEIQELKKGYWLIKLKAIKVFQKTSLLVISDNGIDVPMIELRYNKDAATGKYTMDLDEKQKQVEKIKPIEENTNSEEKSLERKAEEAVMQANKVLEKSIEQLQTSSVQDKDNVTKKEPTTLNKKETEEFPYRYMTKPTFIAGKSNSTYSFLCSNLLQEGKRARFCF
jgi:hypothetical protein